MGLDPAAMDRQTAVIVFDTKYLIFKNLKQSAQTAETHLNPENPVRQTRATLTAIFTA